MSVPIATTDDIKAMLDPLIAEIQALRRDLNDKERSNLPEFLTTKQAAEHKRVTEATIRRWVKTGNIDSVRKGHKILIPREPV